MAATFKTSVCSDSAGKESTCNVGHLALIPGLGRSRGEGERLLTPVFRPGESHGLYGPWGHKSRTRPIDFHFHINIGASPVAQMVKESACSAGDPGSVRGSGRVHGEGNGNPLQYSCLETWTEEPGGLQSVASQRVSTRLRD